MNDSQVSSRFKSYVLSKTKLTIIFEVINPYVDSRMRCILSKISATENSTD